MKKIDFYLVNNLNNKKPKIILLKEIVLIIKQETKIDISINEVVIQGNNLLLKTKPIKKHTILLNKNSVLNKLKELNILINSIS